MMVSSMRKDPISNSEIPNILYKYRDSGKADDLNILENLELYFPSPKKFNDPFDCKIPLDYQSFFNNPALVETFIENTKGGLSEMFSEKEKDDIITISRNNLLTNINFLIGHEQENIKKLNEDIGVLCLSEENNNILLWSHYGQCHKGFCIGLNIDLLLDSDEFATGGPVHYTNLYPKISPAEMGLMPIYTQMFYKSLVWSYEKEYRFIKLHGANSKTRIKPEIIEEIYLGLEIQSKEKDKILSICKNNLPKTKIFRMAYEKGKFGLNSDLIL